MILSFANPTSVHALIIDDDETSLALLQMQLERLGVNPIHAAKDGRAALRLLEQLAVPPDLVVCDLFMPDVDGFEILQSLAQRKYRGGVIMVSGGNVEMLSLTRDIAGLGKLRLLGTLIKPVDAQALSQLVGSLSS